MSLRRRFDGPAPRCARHDAFALQPPTDKEPNRLPSSLEVHCPFVPLVPAGPKKSQRYINLWIPIGHMIVNHIPQPVSYIDMDRHRLQRRCETIFPANMTA